MRFVLKTSGNMHFKRYYDEALSNFAFKFKLGLYDSDDDYESDESPEEDDDNQISYLSDGGTSWWPAEYFDDV
jgi:hypothetical protein